MNPRACCGDTRVGAPRSSLLIPVAFERLRARGGYERVAVRAIPRNIPMTIPAPPATIAAHVPA